MEFQVQILGSNSAIADHGRYPSSQVVSVANHYFLMDCGEGTQMRIHQYKVKWFRISHIFISHLHGDHYYGLIGLLTTYNLLKRTEPLTIFAPALLKEIIELHLKASATKLNYALHFAATSDDQLRLLYQHEEVEVWSFPLKHKIPTTGFLFKQLPGERKLLADKLESLDVDKSFYKLLKQGKDVLDRNGRLIRSDEVTEQPARSKAYAYCSDTMYDERVADYIRQSDLCYHEATYLHASLDRAKETFHSTALQAAMIAGKAQAGKLLIGHFSSRYSDLTLLLNEARSVFQNTELATEGSVFKV